MQHKKKTTKKFDFLKKKNSFASQMFIIQKFEKMVCGAVRLVMVNEIKSSNLFYLSNCGRRQFGGQIDPQKVYIFFAIHFL